jgi:hypothetical protein
MATEEQIGLEKRRLSTTQAQKRLLGLTREFKEANVHKKYLNGLEPDEFTSGLNSLAVNGKVLQKRKAG